MLDCSMSYIERLEELTQDIPALEDLVLAAEGAVVMYDTVTGKSMGYGIINTGAYSIQKVVHSAGTLFPLHVQDEHEYIIVVDGEAQLTKNDQIQTLKKNDCVVIQPGERHAWLFEANTTIIAITVPASKGYPDGAE